MASSQGAISRFVLLLLSVAAMFSGCCAIFEEQVGMYDWHQQYIGRVKLAEFQTQGQRKRVYVATEKNVVAALNLRSGQIAWRKVLGDNDPINAICMYSKYLVTLSGDGRILRAWTVMEGVLVWDTAILAASADGLAASATDLQLLPASKDSNAPPDLVVLARGNIYRVSGATGAILWEAQGFSNTRLSISGGSIYAVSLNSEGTGGAAANGISITKIHPGTGSAAEAIVARSPGALLSSELVITAGVAVVLDQGGSRIFTARLTESPDTLDEMEVVDLVKGRVGVESKRARLLSTKAEGAFTLALGDSLVIVRVGESGQLAVMVQEEGPGAVSHELLVEGRRRVMGIVQHVKRDDIQEVAIKVLTQEGNEEDGSQASVLLPPHRGRAEAVFLNAYARSSSAGGGGGSGYRMLVVMEDDGLLLLQQGEVVWEREEALASVVAVQMVDLPLAAAAREGRHLETSTTEEEGGLEAWAKGHWMRAKVALLLGTPEEQAEVRQRQLRDPAKVAPTRDHNGFRKILVLLTACGKLLGLHNGDGRILWTYFGSPFRTLDSPSGAPSGKPVALDLLIAQDPKRLLVSGGEPIVTVLGREGAAIGSRAVVLFVSAHTGRPLSSTTCAFAISHAFQLPLLVGSEGEKILLLVDDLSPPRAHVFPPSEEAESLVAKQAVPTLVFYRVDEEAGEITGYSLRKCDREGGQSGAGFESQEVWKLLFAGDMEVIAATASRRADEAVNTQTKALGSREVLHKYLNRNLLFVATVAPQPAGSGPVSPDEAWLTAYVIDTVTGRILHKAVHPGMQAPVQAVMAENWVVYHYFNLKSHRYEMSVLEFYDEAEVAGPLDIARYAFGLGGGNLTAPLSSWAGAPKLGFTGQSYYFTHALKSLAVTATSMGITAKHLLLGTSGDQVLSLDKRFLDPRRSLTPSQLEREEGILPYAEALPINPMAYLTHGQPVEGLRKITAEPSRLESTTLIFAFGIDLFSLRTAPSRMYDSLAEDFSYSLLLVTMLALGGAILVTWGLAERRDLQMRWR
eukprot:TRINITY_DN357_c0_g2_i14.p1 TRINITY_DN357_c0_g2~~TRINITY_DN357_c0_g2_i14.p1  ORF type:complete len:1028 (+),score=203.40 TRINITY_DN357_c0_g2_i14:1032-4115(+)